MGMASGLLLIKIRFIRTQAVMIIWSLRRLSDEWMGSIYSADPLDKRMISRPGRLEWDDKRVHHATQNGVQLKIYVVLEFSI